MITGSAAGEIQQYRLTQLQKSCNGKTLEFKSSGAIVTLTIEEAHTPDVQPTVYCTIDDMGPGIFGVRGKAIAAIDPDQDRLREIMQAQCDRYTGVGDNETRRFLMNMVEAGDLVLAVLTPRYLATWGL
jgi:hypothetical protein